MAVPDTSKPPVNRTGHSASGSASRSDAASTAGEVLAGDRSLATVPGLRTVLKQANRLARLAAGTPLPPTDEDLKIWAPTLVVPPPRWNFAGYCHHCTRHGCRSRHCATQWQQAIWAICTICGGQGHDEPSANPCACIGGLMEITVD